MSEQESQSQQRARVVLDVLAGRRSVQEACDELKISEQRFYQLRAKVLASAEAACEPGQPGRPANAPPSPEAVRVKELEAANAELRFEAEAARVREEIALVMPGVLERVRPDVRWPEKKNESDGQVGERKKGRRKGGSSGR